MRSYELMMIHKPELAETDVRGHISEVEATLAAGGEVRASDFWGKRRFSYEIDHVNEGYYSVVEFSGEHELVQRIDRSLALADTIIRHKIIRQGSD